MNEEELKKIIDSPELPGEYGSGREETMRGMIMDSFHTRLRWAVIIIWIYIVGFGAMAVVAGVQFFRVTEVRWMIMCATMFVIGVMVASVCKLWYWQFMHRNRMLREIKRLRLDMAELKEATRK